VTLFKSVLLFLTLLCLGVAIIFTNKSIDDLRYRLNLLQDTFLDAAKQTDINFSIQDAEIGELKDPTYGPMLDDEE